MKTENKEFLDPRVGNLTTNEAWQLRRLAEACGGLDCLPLWMYKEIMEKTEDNKDD